MARSVVIQGTGIYKSVEWQTLANHVQTCMHTVTAIGGVAMAIKKVDHLQRLWMQNRIYNIPNEMPAPLLSWCHVPPPLPPPAGSTGRQGRLPSELRWVRSGPPHTS